MPQEYQLGEVNGSKINHVIGGRNGISKDLAKKLTTVYPQISYEWLKDGVGDMLKKTIHEEKEVVFVKTTTGELIDIDIIVDIILLNQEKFENNTRYMKHLENLKASTIIEYQKEIIDSYKKK